jgi:hypothetical protein
VQLFWLILISNGTLDNFSNIEFLSPVSSRQKKKDQDMNILLPQITINYNKDQRQAIARIESTIGGELKRRLGSLAKPCV